MFNFSLNEMAKNISHRTIDRKMWLSVASLYSRAKGNTTTAKPMSKWDKNEALNRYICGLLIAKDSCPTSYSDIDKHAFPLYGKKAIELGCSINDIIELYNINNGNTASGNQAANILNIDNTSEITINNIDNTKNDNDFIKPNTNINIIPSNKEENKLFKATTKWMAEKYDEMNRWLFKNELGSCNFEIFTTGKGSLGNTLGWFRLSARNLKVDRYSGRVYKYDGYNKEYVNSNNFVELCRPLISLNGNYSGDEETILGTLVHEMCHYADFMKGYCPKRAHGPSWKNWAYIISNRSQGRFSIQRLATAEEMSNLVLSKEMLQKNDLRAANKKANVTIMMIFMSNGTVRLINASTPKLVNNIYNIHKSQNFKGVDKIITSTDPELIDIIFKKFDSTMRTYKYFNTFTNYYNKEIKDYTKYKHTVYYDKENE